MATLQLGPRRATRIDVSELAPADRTPLDPTELAVLEGLDGVYRSLCAMLYNYVPLSGHPGGSISSGRIVISLLFDALDYDVANPDRRDADFVSYAAGHKAMGLYALWALRDEIARIAAPAATRGPARLPAQPDARGAALPRAAVQGARRTPDPGDALPQDRDGGLRCRSRELARPRARGSGPLRP